MQETRDNEDWMTDERCQCVNTIENHCFHTDRCEELVEGCGGSTVYCTGCYLIALLSNRSCPGRMIYDD